MHRARSPGLSPPRTTRGYTILPLVVVVLIVIGLFVLWLNSSEERTPRSTGKAAADVHEFESSSHRDPAALADPASAAPVRTTIESRAEAPAEECLEVRVSTRVSLLRTSQRVPGIQVEVGYGTAFEEGDLVLGRGETDERGDVVITVPKRALDQTTSPGGARYWARVVEPGYERRTGGASRAPDADPRHIVVIAYPGQRVSGRVVDRAGRAVSASVYAHGVRTNGPLSMSARVATKADGTFVLWCKDLARVTIIADAGPLGTGVMSEVTVPREPGCEPLTIVVQGHGVVRGRVSDTSGAPAAGLDLLVLVADLDDANGSFVLPQPRGNEIELEGRGRAYDTPVTGANGTFEVTGLRDDRYVVRARTSSRSGYPILLTSAPVQADGAPLELSLTRPHIVVHVVDSKGARWTEPFDFEEDGTWSNTPRADRPDLVVTAARDSAHAFDRWGYLAQGRAIGESSYAFDVTADREYTVALWGMGLRFTSKNVTVPLDASRVEVVLTAAPVGAFGTLDVEPKLSDGSDPKSGLVLRLEDPSSGFPIVERDVNYTDGKRVALSVPEGAYTLVVAGAARHEMMHGTVMSACKVGRGEMNVVVRAGETTHVEPVLGTGARVHLKLEGAVDDADRGALDKGVEAWNLDEWASLVQLQLTTPGRWPTPVSFLWEMKGSSAAGTHERSEMPFGTDQLSELLPSGSYTLEARTRGGRIVTVPVVLVDGQTTAVTVRFPESR